MACLLAQSGNAKGSLASQPLLAGGLIQETWGSLPQSQPAKNYCNHFYKEAGGTQTAKEHLGRLGVSSVRQSLNPGISGLAFASIDSIPSWRNRRLIYGLESCMKHCLLSGTYFLPQRQSYYSNENNVNTI